MKKVIFDTSFILSCVRKKIDFFEETAFMGLKIIIPNQVIKEIERVANSKKKLHFREDAQLSLKLLKGHKFEEIDLDKGHVDKALIKFTEKNPKIVIATLDRELKKKIVNSKLVIRGGKLEII